MSKMLSSALVFIIATLVGLFVPEYGDVEAITAGFLNLVAAVSMIMAFTEGTKIILKYDSDIHSKWIPKSITMGWSLILATVGFFTNFGFYGEMFDAWYQVAITSVIVAGVARDFYNVELAWRIIKMMFGKEIPMSK